MDITVQIDDSQISSFSTEAKSALTQVCKDYASAIIDEAKRIEQTDRVGSGQAEVIASHIDEARKNYRRPLSVPRWKIVVDIVVELLILFVGGLFDKTELLNNNLFLGFYIVLVITTVAFLVVKYARGGPG